MALKKTFKNQGGETSNGYYRVREVYTQYEKDKDDVMGFAASFTVEAYDHDTGEPVSYRKIAGGPPWEPEGVGIYGLIVQDTEPVQNLIIKAYEHLKTLPEFSEAIDC